MNPFVIEEGTIVFFYKIVKGLAPSYLQSYLFPHDERTYNTRSSSTNKIKTFAMQTSTFCTIFFLTAQKNGTNEMMILQKLNQLNN